MVNEVQSANAARLVNRLLRRAVVASLQGTCSASLQAKACLLDETTNPDPKVGGISKANDQLVPLHVSLTFRVRAHPIASLHACLLAHILVHLVICPPFLQLLEDVVASMLTVPELRARLRD